MNEYKTETPRTARKHSARDPHPVRVEIKKPDGLKIGWCLWCGQTWGDRKASLESAKFK